MDWYSSSAVTPFFRKTKTLCDRSLRILDVGCGTGMRSLELARANPSSDVLGIDFSAAALNVARGRQRVHRVDNVSFLASKIEDLPALGLSFDYINCDDTLYLLDSPADGLAVLRSLLREGGIVRANVHNESCRRNYLRVGRALDLLGTTDLPLGEAIAETRQLFRSFNKNVRAKRLMWGSRKRGPSSEVLLSNHMLVGDKAYTLEQVFEMIEAADLRFIDFVDHRRWEAEALFVEGADFSSGVVGRVSRLSRFDLLKFISLVSYSERLFDFWCCGSDDRAMQQQKDVDLGAGKPSRGGVRVHPALIRSGAVGEAARLAREEAAMNLSRYIPNLSVPRLGRAVWISGASLHLFVAIGVGEMSVSDLVERWLALRPLHTDSGARRTRHEAEAEVVAALKLLSWSGAVLCADAVLYRS